MDRLIKIYLMLSLIAVGGLAWAGLPNKGKLTSGTSQVKLQEGVYTVDGNVTINVGGSSSGVILSNSKAVIFLKKNSKLTIKGGDANGKTGAGAGLRVMSGDTLVITGQGTVEATGGSAAKGQDALTDNETGYTNSDQVRGGKGATGGYGGGGAAAGIGGFGGDGGNGGSGGGSIYKACDHDCDTNGNGGSSGSSGNNGTGMGTLYVLGTTQVKGNAGSAAAGGSASSTRGGETYTWTYKYTAGGGGGSGGGGGGGKAYAIGGGAGGGGGGGGGGSGGLDWTGAGTTMYQPKGGQGGGGSGGASSGSSGGGSRSNGTYSDRDSTGGGGGSGGSGGGLGSGGSLYVASTASVSVKSGDSIQLTQATATTHDFITYTITFADPDNQLTTKPEAIKAYLGLEMKQESLPSVCKDANLCVAGWYTEKNGKGVKYFDQIGKNVQPTYEVVGDLTLYPYIRSADLLSTGIFVNGEEVDPSTDKVNGAGWKYADKMISFTDEDGTFTISGTNRINTASLYIEKSANLVFENLEIVASTPFVNGIVMVAPDTKANIELKGQTTLNALGAKDMTAIHCPVGASVHILSKEDRGVKSVSEAAIPEIESEGVASPQLFARGGEGAAAIGGKKNEASGNITIENCNLRVDSKTDSVGIGCGLLDSAEDVGKADIITFIGFPILSNFKTGVAVSQLRPSILPRPHNEYSRALFPHEGSANDNCFFVPTGWLKYTYKSGTPQRWTTSHNAAHNKSEEWK